MLAHNGGQTQQQAAVRQGKALNLAQLVQEAQQQQQDKAKPARQP